MQSRINGVSMAEPPSIPSIPSNPLAVAPVPSGGGESKPLSRGGIQFLQALGLLFIGLKLGGIIDWHWLLVLLPLYIEIVAAVAVWIATIVVAVCIGVMVTIWFIAKAAFLKITKRK